MMTKLENLISSDLQGDWKLHLQSIKDLLPLFAAFDSTNYLRWCSLYLGDMHRLPKTLPKWEILYHGKKSTQRITSKSQETAIQRTIDIARERGHSIQKLLKYNIRTTFYLFDDEGLMKSATKSDLTRGLEKHLLTESSRNFPIATMSLFT